MKLRLMVYGWLLLSIQLVVPASLWHSLCAHEDTHQCGTESRMDFHLESQHIHCLSLELGLPPLMQTDNALHCFIPSFSYSYPAAPTLQSICLPLPLSSDRGPPNVSADLSALLKG
jgi:hypothetical protein